MTPDDEPTPAPTPDATPDHQPDGLELARQLTRATAGSSPRARARQRKQDRVTRGRVTGSHPDDRDPQLLDATLGRFVAQHGWELELRMRGVFARWQELVGDEIADHTTPETFVAGRLVVRTDSTAWATQLRLLAPTILARLNEELGQGTVTSIDVQGPVGPTWKKGRRSTRDGRGPRDTYG